MTLAAERKAAAQRRWRERVERTARSALNAVGRGASLKHAEAYIRETWTGLDDGQVDEVLARVGTMREETNDTRRLTPEEIEVARRRKTRETKAAIRELLTRDPGMTSTEMWGRCRAQGVDLTAKSSFPSLCSEVRKEMGVSGAKARRRSLEKAKATTTEPPARQPSEEAEAAQPPEEGGDEPSPAPPPAAPVAEDEDDEGCPKGDPNCLAPNDGEWYSHEACEAPEATEYSFPPPELDVSDDDGPHLWITYRTGEEFGLVDRRSGAARLVSITMPPKPTVSQWEIIKRYAELAT